jgi:hypothetical protein
VWVANIDVLGILGYDFLKKNRCVLDTREGTVEVGGEPKDDAQEEVTSSEDELCNLVRIAETVSIPPESETVIPARLQRRQGGSDFGILQGIPKFSEKHQLMVAALVVNTETDSVPIRLLNPTSQPVTLYTGTGGAVCETVEEVISLGDEEKCNTVHQNSATDDDVTEGMSTTTKCEIPGHMENLVKQSREQVDDTGDARSIRHRPRRKRRPGGVNMVNVPYTDEDATEEDNPEDEEDNPEDKEVTNQASNYYDDDDGSHLETIGEEPENFVDVHNTGDTYISKYRNIRRQKNMKWKEL